MWRNVVLWPVGVACGSIITSDLGDLTVCDPSISVVAEKYIGLVVWLRPLTSGWVFIIVILFSIYLLAVFINFIENNGQY